MDARPDSPAEPRLSRAEFAALALSLLRDMAADDPALRERMRDLDLDPEPEPAPR